VRVTLTQLVKAIYKDRHPLKPETEVQKFVDSTVEGRVDEWVWGKILEKMYESTEAQQLYE